MFQKKRITYKKQQQWSIYLKKLRFDTELDESVSVTLPGGGNFTGKRKGNGGFCCGLYGEPKHCLMKDKLPAVMEGTKKHFEQAGFVCNDVFTNAGELSGELFDVEDFIRSVVLQWHHADLEARQKKSKQLFNLELIDMINQIG
jgi:hypothetical protein